MVSRSEAEAMWINLLAHEDIARGQWGRLESFPRLSNTLDLYMLQRSASLLDFQPAHAKLTRSERFVRAAVSM